MCKHTTSPSALTCSAQLAGVNTSTTTATKGVSSPHVITVAKRASTHVLCDPTDRESQLKKRTAWSVAQCLIISTMTTNHRGDKGRGRKENCGYEANTALTLAAWRADTHHLDTSFGFDWTRIEASTDLGYSVGILCIGNHQ